MNNFLLVASDIHSDEEAFSTLSSIARQKECMAFLYAGDLDIENPLIEMELNNRNFAFLPVLGNCDSPWMYSTMGIPTPPLCRTCTYNNLRITISHGHVYVPSGNSQVVITGHTHISKLYEENGTVFLNPGSASRPRGNSEKSFALIEYSGSEVLISIRELESKAVISEITVFL